MECDIIKGMLKLGRGKTIFEKCLALALGISCKIICSYCGEEFKEGETVLEIMGVDGLVYHSHKKEECFKGAYEGRKKKI